MPRWPGDRGACCGKAGPWRREGGGSLLSSVGLRWGPPASPRESRSSAWLATPPAPRPGLLRDGESSAQRPPRKAAPGRAGSGGCCPPALVEQRFGVWPGVGGEGLQWDPGVRRSCGVGRAAPLGEEGRHGGAGAAPPSSWLRGLQRALGPPRHPPLHWGWEKPPPSMAPLSSCPCPL